MFAIKKNIRDEGSTALLTADTVVTVYTVDTLYTVDIVDMAYTVDMIYMALWGF